MLTKWAFDKKVTLEILPQAVKNTSLLEVRISVKRTKTKHDFLLTYCAAFLLCPGLLTKEVMIRT